MVADGLHTFNELKEKKKKMGIIFDHSVYRVRVNLLTQIIHYILPNYLFNTALYENISSIES